MLEVHKIQPGTAKPAKPTFYILLTSHVLLLFNYHSLRIPYYSLLICHSLSHITYCLLLKKVYLHLYSLLLSTQCCTELRTSYYLLLIFLISIYHLLFVTCYLLRVTYYLLFITYYALLTTYYILSITYHSLLSTYSLLLMSYYVLPVT